MTTHFKKFGVIGGGAWGTAIAQMLTRDGQDVLIWCREPEVAEAINTRHENTVFLPGVALKPALKATSDLADLAGMDAVFAVAPAQHTRATLKALKGTLKPGTPVVLCSKGIELATGEFMTQVLKDELPDAVPAVMSGPSFAIDVAQGLPTAVTFAIEDEALGTELIGAISTPTFRPYLAHDLLGAEVGGAVKNVLAIACGIALGKGLGRSAHAALIARGSAEMTRLALKLGAERETLAGLSGLGDLVLTCSSETSRNMSCGMALGRGESLESIMGARNAVTEGVATAPVLKKLAAEHGVEMPICDAVAAVIEGEISVDEAIVRLLMRPTRAEAVTA
ncbi:NAD(P)H-dependent glycerol-3-phosphate dehydrogenase [Hyphomonas sp.]|jgi:glycerol-3-phosphate dehydrogenase (NAD(P)+)|uniref:NAD(P)H-dependent glycerol-3-phosphate dehydrogenase n=1 Tax=Hyphomonas sp. TaxID=87 RepID=UPI000C6BFD4F|nr:NAD(P)H-dependent glycerol-3-phosphate dehydrogenase [Hyphomonas sp.]MAB10821.1 glycerol-3-phosphate dehydrogenase [Hyphomonas sp.]MAU67510.1 glycerol-3-phosphate dehydrogenase [Hyphomonas sp.]